MKRICLFCFLGLAILGIAFHQAILTKMVSWSVQAYSISKWGQTLHYDDFSLDEGRLVFTNPHFDDNFTTEKAMIDFSFDWKHRLFDLHVDLIKPQFHLQPKWEKWLGALVQKPGWLKSHVSINLRDGSLILPKNQVRFDLMADSQKGAEIHFHFDEGSNQLELITVPSSEGMEIKCSFNKTSCHSLLALAELFDLSLPPLQISSGLLEGELKALFPASRKISIEGELLVEQLAFHSDNIPLTGNIELARLKLENRIGRIDILKPSELNYDQWSLNEITGGITLNGLEAADISLEAVAEKSGHFSKWLIEGNAHRSLNLDLSIRSSKGKAQFAIDQEQALIRMENLSYIDISILQGMISTFWPSVADIEFKNGIFDALLEADIDHGIGEVRLKHFRTSQLCAKLKQWNAICRFDLVNANGKAVLGQEDFWNTLQAGLHLENGSFNFEEMTPDLPLTDIQGHLLINNGDIENSLITLQLASLKGKMDVDWGEQKQLLTFNLDGTVKDLVELFPSTLQDGLRSHFYDNRLTIQANLKNHNHQFELGGKLHIQENEILFGCDLKRLEDGLVPSGWFYANQLPIEKYLSPFLFRDGLLHMEGNGEFRGEFDNQRVTIKYDADHLKIENGDLRIEIDGLHSLIPGQLAGEHQINIQTLDHSGSFPIQNGTYYEKNNGLHFKDIQGMVHLSNGKMEILPLEATCQEVYFSGGLDLDYSDPSLGVFNLSIHCPTISGKVSQIQHLLAHLEPSSLLHQFPLEGDVSARNEGLNMNFAFQPKDYALKANVEAAVAEGSIAIESADMSLKGIYMDMSYDHDIKQLRFTDIQGTCLVGKPLRVEEYLLTGNHIQIDKLLEPDIDLDIVIKDQEDEIFRLVGKTEGKKFILDPKLSHISCLYPKTWDCTFHDWSRIDHFEFSSQFDVKDFLQDLTRFRKSGFLFLSHCMIDKLALFLPIHGQGSLSLQTEPDQSYSFQFEGKEIQQGDAEIHSALLKGRKREKKWIIDQFQWDDWNIYAELIDAGEKWKIPFLGLNLEEGFLLGLEGDFIPNDGLLQGSLKFCEINVTRLNRWKMFQSLMTQWDPKGDIKATGEFEWSCLLSNPMDGFKASFVAETNNLSFKNDSLSIPEPFSVDVKEGVVFRFPKVKFENDFLGFKTKGWDFKEIDLQIGQEELIYSAMTAQERYPFQILGSIKKTDFQSGQTSLLNEKENLLIKWEKEKGDLILKSVKGVFAGALFDLSQDIDQNQWKALKGSMTVDFDQISPLFPLTIAEKISQFKLKSPFTFLGNFWMNPDLGNSLLETIYFKGKLNAQEAIFKGFQVQKIEANVQYVPGRLDVQNLLFQDPAGVIKIPSFIALLDPKQDVWSLFMPQLSVRNFRVFLLRDTENEKMSNRSKYRNLIVKRIDIRDFYGELNSQETWRANGNLHFSNPSRKNFFHPLFAIPGEIILRLGLDPNVLNPVTGSINFSLNGDRFYLRKLKDVYSEGRGSKFYLAEGPSWMDLRGNLSVQFRMKQYNLIFKIAELFTVSVKGDIRKPVYTLQKQPSHKKNPLRREKLS